LQGVWPDKATSWNHFISSDGFPVRRTAQPQRMRSRQRTACDLGLTFNSRPKNQKIRKCFDVVLCSLNLPKKWLCSEQ